MPNNRNQIEREKLIIRLIVDIYCRGQRHTASGTCADYGVILRYANEHIDLCPYNDTTKQVCGLCRSNYFTPKMHSQFVQITRHAPW